MYSSKKYENIIFAINLLIPIYILNKIHINKFKDIPIIFHMPLNFKPVYIPKKMVMI